MEQPRPARTASALVARLARDLAVLVRVEAEAAVLRRAREARRTTVDVLQVVAAGAAVLVALGALTWAAVRGLDTTALPGWAAPLVVAGGWLVLAAGLARPALTLVSSLDELRSDEHDAQAREAAETDARASVEALLDVVLSELARHEQRRLVDAARDELDDLGDAVEDIADGIEDDVRDLEERAESALEELVDIVTLPGRRGLDALRRLVR